MNVAIPTIWFKRGQSYISLAMKQALELAGHQVFIYARTGGVQGKACLETTGEFKVDNFTTYPAYEIPPEIFEAWLKKNSIDLVLFNEEQYQKGLGSAAKQAECKVAGYVCREFINPDDLSFYQDYDVVICPTKDCLQVVNSLGLPGKYIQWGVDLNLFKPNDQIVRKSDETRFFHPAGWGGMCERRGTSLAVEAFKMAKLSKAKLLVHMQSLSAGEMHEEGDIRYVSGNLRRKDLISYYQFSDVAVLPSKHEGLGLSYMEAQACGLAVLGIDAAPMNEHVNSGGYNCLVSKFEAYPSGSMLFVKAAVVDTLVLAEKMNVLHDSSQLKIKKERALTYAQECFDWKKNGQELVRELEAL